MGRIKNRHRRDFDYENSLLHEIAELYNGGKLSSRDRLILEAATHARHQMNMLHFADAEELVDWCTYCHNVEMNEYWNSEDREAWKVVWKILWEKLVRVIRYGQGVNKGTKEFPAKEVLQYDLEGNLVKRWPSGNKASIGLGITNQDISRCCHGIISHCGLWVFKFASEVINMETNGDGQGETK